MNDLLWLGFGSDPLTWPRWPIIAVGVVFLVWLLLPRSSVTGRDLWRELAVVIFAYFCYFGVRGFIHGREFEAFNRAADVIHIERGLGIFWEVHLQGFVLTAGPLVNLANWTYVWGHWPVIILVAAWLFLMHREAYSLYRNAFIISGAIGLVIFALFPTAPPRYLLAWGFIDTANAYHLGPSTSVLVNEFAAMPSLHFGWNLLVGIALFRHAEGRIARAMGIIMPAAMFLAIVCTGNHFILDGIAGGIVALIGLWGAYLARDYFEKSPPRMLRQANAT